MFIIYNEAIDKAMREDPYIPPPPPLVDDINKPLAFQSEKDGSTVTLKKSGSQLSAWGDFEISRDGGEWEDYTVSTPITLNRGHYVSFRTKTTAGVDKDSFWKFFMSGKINAYNNINSMVSADFLNLSELAPYQFHHLFDDCPALYKAPLLPATTLAPYCYWYTFSLCYRLTKAPYLPATILAEHCYERMFFVCSKLKEVRISATTTADGALIDWLTSVSDSGNFYCDPNATIFPAGASGIPLGWTRLPLSDYPTT